jgi:hypothetical protein
MARANRAWSYTCIECALQNLSNEIGRGTVANVLNEGAAKTGSRPAKENCSLTG